MKLKSRLFVLVPGIILFLSILTINKAYSQESASEMQEYCGTYGGIRTISFEDGKLFSQRIGGPKIELTIIEKDRFKLFAPQGMRPLPTLNFSRDENGDVIGMFFIHPDGRKDAIVPKEITPAKPEPISDTEKGELIEKLSEVLKERYVFPDIAKQYASLLKQNEKSGKYADINDKTVLASTLAKDLNSFHSDGHLRIMTKEYLDLLMKEEQKQEPQNIEVEKGKSEVKPSFMHSKILDNNIGYIKINSFPNSEEAQEYAHNVMQSVKDCKAIIFDLNDNMGGGVPIINIIASYLFDKPTHMVSSWSAFENNGKEKKHISEPNEFSKKMAKIPVYLLISNVTGSAGEHFSLVFKYTKRGLLVGKTTHGIAHFAGYVPLTENFVALIPFGRTYNPDTGEDWEGVGIHPDVEMDSDKSMDWVLKEINK